MNCSHAEHLLSLNLDGRLSTGQRRLLTTHLAACARCRDADRELVEARELALSLPVQHVSEGFREELWQRIRAGEGTPEAVFREPIPIAAKVRYFVTGAAAAGLLILASHVLRRGEADHVGGTGGENHARPALEVSAAAPAPGRLVRRDPVARPAVADFAVVPATPDSLAELVANGYTDAVRTLHANVQALDGRPVTPELVARLRNEADLARDFAGMLRWLMDGKYMMLPEHEAANLTAIEVVGEQVRSFEDPDSLRRVLRPIRSLPIHQPTSYFCSPCVKDESRFYQEFLARLRTARLDRAIGTMIEVVPEPTPMGDERFVIFIRK